MDPFIKWLREQNLISKGDVVYVISDMFGLSKAYHEKGLKLDLNVLIDGLWDIVGPDGTLLFPAFNWDFCKGVGFGMTVVTEGVETKEQVKFLTKLGVDILQGYYYSKPLHIDDFEKKYL